MCVRACACVRACTCEIMCYSTIAFCYELLLTSNTLAVPHVRIEFIAKSAIGFYWTRDSLLLLSTTFDFGGVSCPRELPTREQQRCDENKRNTMLQQPHLTQGVSPASTILWTEQNKLIESPPNLEWLLQLPLALFLFLKTIANHWRTCHAQLCISHVQCTFQEIILQGQHYS